METNIILKKIRAEFAAMRAVEELLISHAAYRWTGIGRSRLAAICHTTFGRFDPTQRMALLDRAVAEGRIVRHRLGMGEYGHRHECYTAPGVTPS